MAVSETREGTVQTEASNRFAARDIRCEFAAITEALAEFVEDVDREHGSSLTQRDFDWGSGTELYWDLAVDPTQPLDLQLDALKEDLVHATFPDGTVVDVGWYPEFHATGCFVTVVVRNGNWESPVVRLQSRSLPELREAIAAALSAARSHG